MTTDTDKFKELFDSRNDHERRVYSIEKSIDQMVNHSKDMKDMISGFIDKVNGLPMSNAKEISQMKNERCAPMAEKMDNVRKTMWMMIGMGVIITVVLIPIAIEVIPMIFKK